MVVETQQRPGSTASGAVRGGSSRGRPPWRGASRHRASARRTPPPSSTLPAPPWCRTGVSTTPAPARVTSSLDIDLAAPAAPVLRPRPPLADPLPPPLDIDLAEPAAPVPRRRTRSRERPARRGSAHRAAAVIVGLWATAVMAAAVVSPSDAVNRVALFVHLSSLLVGFGPVLVVDLHGLLWLARRRSLLEVARLAAVCDPLIWAGLFGLVASGVLLEPDLSSPLTRIKLGLVLLVALNGLRARRLEHELRALPADAQPADLPRGYLARAALSATVSQAGWWGAIAIGLSNMGS